MTSTELRRDARNYIKNMPYALVKDIARGVVKEPQYVKDIARIEMEKRKVYSNLTQSNYDIDYGIDKEHANCRKTKKRTKLSLKCPRCRAKDSENLYPGVWQCNVCGCEFGDGVRRKR
jgi:ribosomal protein L37AE/L43A